MTEVAQDRVRLATGEDIPYGICVWSAGNAPRPLVAHIAEQLPVQAELSPGGRTSKLLVDPFLRVVGARDIIALGDCSSIIDGPLPATAQVAAQQGAYAAHLINRGYEVGLGGLEEEAPRKPAAKVTWNEGLYGTMDSLDVEEGRYVYYRKVRVGAVSWGGAWRKQGRCEGN